MTSNDSPLVSPVSPIETRSPFDNEFPEPHSPATSRHVPFDYFSRNDSQVLSPGFEQQSVHDRSGGISATGTLVGDEFRFDKFLQDKWDKAAAEGINCRQTGVVFKVCLRSMSFSIP